MGRGLCSKPSFHMKTFVFGSPKGTETTPANRKSDRAFHVCSVTPGARDPPNGSRVLRRALPASENEWSGPTGRVCGLA